MKKNKKFLWALAGVALVIGLIVIAWFWGRKEGAEDLKDNPYLILQNYSPEPEAITKSEFEKIFSNGGEIFDWMLNHDYFYEKEGVSAHPRFISPDEKAGLKNKYPGEYAEIVHILQHADSRRHAFVVKSAELSSKLSDQAWDALKHKDIKKALEDCKTAIDLFPINAKPYLLLTKLYLMTGQELKMYETLTLAGRSYPNFNNIIGIINDHDLANIPLDGPQDTVFLANFHENKRTAISFLFDDGERDVYVNALPAFEKYGFRATVPIIAGMVAEKDGDEMWGSWGEWKDAANRGFEIANHSMYHRDSQKLHGDDFDIAIDQAKDMIEKNTGQKVTAYVFPHDSYNDEAVGRALRAHEAVRTWEFLRSIYNRTVGIVYGGPYFSVETANRLVDIGIQRQLWIVANCHGVTTKHGILSYKSITPALLDQHLSYIHSKSGDVWVDTFTHVFEYVRQRAQTTIEIKGVTGHSADFVLHGSTPGVQLLLPLTVVVKAQKGVAAPSAVTAGGHQLKAWACAMDQICVDADSTGDNIHVEYKIGAH